MTGGRGTPPLLLGVRHHGPGSARAVAAALEASRPDVLLIEGPPEADALVELAGSRGLRPPVALLAYVTGESSRAAFWPLAEFSPEWVALRWAVRRGVPVRFFDLPAGNTLALRDREGGSPEPEPDAAGGDLGSDLGGDLSGDPGNTPGGPRPLRVDPLAELARAAGYDDPERWWEDAVEHRGRPAGETGQDALAPFAAVEEAMTALRERPPEGTHEADRVHGPDDPRRDHPDDARREAHMRLRLREAVREFERVAVVCGAWHVPALRTRTTVSADRALLKGLPRVKVGMTWVPWTHRRLSRRSGYGAGITSPGWYGHLFSAPDRPLERWMTRVAGLLRDEDRHVSPAHVIEAVRLAETLATLRGRPLAGLTETLDAVRAVMCEGSDVPLALVHDRLVVGDALGEVPHDAPAVPLQRDLERAQRSLRLPPTARDREVDLDLRRDIDSGRSRLLHRLRLLDVPWGEPTHARTGNTGTFRESWRLRWEPELALRVVEEGVWGTTVEGAATARARSRARAAGSLSGVSTLAERCLLAHLPDALPVVMRALADRAALDADVGELALALPPLVRAMRYGDVRGTDSSSLTRVAEGLVERVCVGLPPACAGLDQEGAAQMRTHLDSTHRAVALMAQAGADGGTGPGTDLRPRFRETLRSLATRDTAPGLIQGRCVRLLLDEGELDDEEVARWMGRALSRGTDPERAATWVEGFLSGGGMLLVHDRRLLGLVDAWLTRVPEEAFVQVLPLLRRTFAEFETGVRRTVGELVRRGPEEAPDPDRVEPPVRYGFAAVPDRERADAVLPTLRSLRGPGPGGPPTEAAPVPAPTRADPTPAEASGIPQEVAP
ncbi:DUF5682 family protein [Streptomyces sp. NPDC005438]|uniref:DUF5682 family protein n=1 Tax=Streptomyces sp. NPDC005438 TaxID=3156880 RepID=UPI0033A44490